MRRRILFGMLAWVVMATLGPSALAQETPPAPLDSPPLASPAAPVVNKVKIIVDHKAKSNGEIRFDFAPAGETPRAIRVTVVKGMREEEICRDIAKELTVVLGEGFAVRQYDPDKVKVEGKNGAKFSLTLGIQTVSGITITLK